MTNQTVNKPWFKKTEIRVALFGVIAPFIITYLINVFDKDQKEISITYTAVDPIISESNEITNNLVINYDSTSVENISKVILKIKNTGTLCLTKNDFVDGPININIKYLNGVKSVILQLIEKENANQQNSKLTYNNSKTSSQIIYTPSLLNPKDEVIIEAYILNTPNITITSKGKILDGNIFGPKPIEIKENKIGYKSFVLSWSSFFGNKWISILIDIILFFFMALSCLFLLGMSMDKEFKGRGSLLGSMSFVTGVTSIFLIAIIVSTLLYS